MPMTERQKVVVLMNGDDDPEFDKWWNEVMAPSGVEAHPSIKVIKGAARIAWHEAMMRYGVEGHE